MSYRFGFPDVDDFSNAGYKRDGELRKIGEERYVLANIELRVAGERDEVFVWTCWAPLSVTSYDRMDAPWERPHRENQEPAFGWLSNALPTYSPTTLLLKLNRSHTRAWFKALVGAGTDRRSLSYRTKRRRGTRADCRRLPYLRRPRISTTLIAAQD